MLAIIRCRILCLPVRYLKIWIFKYTELLISPVVLYGSETWSLTLREERRLRVFENKVLRKMFGPKRDEVTGEWRKLHNEELNDLFCSPKIIRVINREEGDGRGMQHVWGRGEVLTKFWWGNLRKRHLLEDPGLDGTIILKWIFRKWDGGMDCFIIPVFHHRVMTVC